jgi:hypothetical protein
MPDFLLGFFALFGGYQAVLRSFLDMVRRRQGIVMVLLARGKLVVKERGRRREHVCAVYAAT